MAGSGKRGGARANAGRKPNVPNKATVERALIAARIAQEQAGKPGRKLAREVLDDFMALFTGMAAMHQPLPDGVVPMNGQKPDEAKFLLFAQLAVDTAAELAPYQSPKFKATIQLPELPPGDNFAGAIGDQAGVHRMTPQQAYRMLRDADVIDVQHQVVAGKPVKKAASGG